MSDTNTNTRTTAEELESPVPRTVWACLNYEDAHAAIKHLVDVFGFVSTATHTDPDDDEVVVHAELRWPEGGGVMLGTANREHGEFSQLPTGASSLYVVTDDPHSIYDRVKDAGSEIVRDMRDEDYGSTGFSVRDPEGNIWSFGTYRGE